jgi:hypothetical protein
MPDAQWTISGDGIAGARFYSATINTANPQTAVLQLKADSLFSVAVDLGSGETVQLKAHNKPWTSSLTHSDLLVDTTVTGADFIEDIKGPITCFAVSGAVTNATVITLCETSR